MRRSELEHIIRAASMISNAYEVVIIGSQSILGSIPNPPRTFKMTPEADVFVLKSPESAEMIDGAIGEGSHFHQTNGYYAHGVGPETAVLPSLWQTRLVRIQNEATDLRVGLCLDPIDLAASKLVAGREKDKEFVEEMLRYNFAPSQMLIERIGDLPIPEPDQARLRQWVEATVTRLDSEKAAEEGE